MCRVDLDSILQSTRPSCKNDVFAPKNLPDRISSSSIKELGNSSTTIGIVNPTRSGLCNGNAILGRHTVVCEVKRVQDTCWKTRQNARLWRRGANRKAFRAIGKRFCGLIVCGVKKKDRMVETLLRSLVKGPRMCN
jgi:hypothetical protein